LWNDKTQVKEAAKTKSCMAGTIVRRFGLDLGLLSVVNRQGNCTCDKVYWLECLFLPVHQQPVALVGSYDFFR
jgi:hypothetical protein